MKSNTRKYVEFGALCLLALAILWWFGRKLNWVEVRQAVSHANPYLLGLAVLIISLAYFFRAARWGALLAPLSPASLRNLFIATTVGFGAVFLLGRTGEVVRPVVLPMRDPRIRPSASFVTIMVERIYDMLAVVASGRAGTEPGAGTVTETYASDGGSITVGWDGSALSLQGVSPAVGFDADVEDDQADRIRVRFQGDDGDFRIEIRLENGELVRVE